METNFTVSDQDAGARLDKWLCARFPHFSRNQIKQLLDGGRVLVNRRRVVIAGWELDPGDDVELRLPPGFASKRDDETDAPQAAEQAPRPAGPMERAEELEEKAKIRDSLERYFARQKERRRQPPPEREGQEGRKGRDRHGRRGEKGERKGGERREQGGRERGRQEGGHEGRKRLRIFHEDRDIIVVEKPAGMLAVPADEHEKERESLLAEIHAYLQRRHPNAKGSFVGPLHRLDVETSGIMVFALSKDGGRLEQQFRDHSIRRDYTAIVAGRLEEEEGIIDIPLEKGEFGEGKKVRPAPEGTEGRRAVTEFRVKERYANATLVELRVRTGRTHQIRVHLAEKGFPLVGDKLYGAGAATGAPHFPRHALHANSLGFRHPVTKKKYTFHSGMPRDMKELLEQLRSSV